jgi:DNA-binding Lrp family transcriptional regulator
VVGRVRAGFSPVAASVTRPRRTQRLLRGAVVAACREGVPSLAIGFVLISTAPAKEHEVYTELLRVKGIVELHPLFGEYDLIAKVEAEDFNALGQLVVDKIRSVPGVIDTKTLTGIKF